MQLSPKEIERIDEIEVDCYKEHEVNLGWYIFLNENLNYPFEAEYQISKADGNSSWNKVKVIASESTEDDFNRNEFYVTIEVNELIIPTRLSRLKNIIADEGTIKTLQIWNYSKKL